MELEVVACEPPVPSPGGRIDPANGLALQAALPLFVAANVLVTALRSPLAALNAVRIVSRPNLLTDRASNASAGIANNLNGMCVPFSHFPCLTTYQKKPSLISLSLLVSVVA